MVRIKKAYLLAGVLALLVALPLSGAFAGSTGKIMGRISDSSGGPLPGASVRIEGTQRGAIADADGYYLIVAVDPGTYDLSASLVGYGSVTKETVQVQVDYTSTLNFQLKEQAIQADEIVVTAERAVIEVDKTSTKYVLSSEEIEETPIIKSTAELVSLQPGVAMDGTFSVRGSDYTAGDNPVVWATSGYNSADVYVIIDGVRVPRGDGNSALLFTGINKSAVQQISVETGVTPAEYGDSKAGTINIVTQDGGKRFHGWTEVNYEPSGQKHWGEDLYVSPYHEDKMKWGDLEWEAETDPVTGRLVHVRDPYSSISGVVLEGSVSGPVIENVGFVASAKHQRRAPVYPEAGDHGFYDQTGHYTSASNNIQGSASLTFRPSANMKVKAGLMLQMFTAINNEVNNRNYGAEGFVRGQRSGAARLKNIFLRKDWSAGGAYDFKEELEYLTLTHSLSPKTFYEVRVGRSTTTWDTTGIYLGDANNNGKKDPGETFGVPTVTTLPRKDADGWFFVDREVAMWIDSDRKRWSFKADLSSQLTKGNFVKTGLELITYNAYFQQWAARSTTDHWISFYSGGDEPWKVGSPAKPIRGAFYVQDKMEFEGMIVNVGLRLDVEKTTHDWPISASWIGMPMWDRYSMRSRLYGVDQGDGFPATGNIAYEPPWRRHLSPRLGVSHPITDKMVMHFSLGRYIQWIDLFQMNASAYRNYGRKGADGDPSWEDVNGNGTREATEQWAAHQPNGSGIAGDPHWAGPEESFTFEVGADWNFVSDYTASLTVYYRSDTNQYSSDGSSLYIPGDTGNGIRGAANSYLQWSKGLELATGKRMSNYFSYRLSLSNTWGANGWGGRSNSTRYEWPDSNFVASGEYWRYRDNGTDGKFVPRALTPEQIVSWGRSQMNVVRNYTVTYENNPLWFVGWAPDFEPGYGVWRRMNSRGGTNYGIQRRYGYIGRSRTMQANAQFVLNTPSNLTAGGRFLGWLVSDLNANMLWKLRSGGTVNWAPPGSATQRRDRGPIDAMTDLSVEKTFNSKGRVRTSLFVEIRNVFADKQDTGGGANYMRYGLQMSPPDNTTFLKYGDTGDRSYYGSPRRTDLGVRVIF